MRCLRGVARAKGIDLQLAPPGLSVRMNNKAQVVYNKKERWVWLVVGVTDGDSNCGLHCT